MAAGLTVAEARLDDAMAALSERLAREGAGVEGPRDLAIDGCLAPGGATAELVTMMEAAGPFGQANPAPRVALGDVIPVSARRVGNGHLQIRLRGAGGGPILGAIAFGAAENGIAELVESRADLRAPVHLAGRLEIDDWGGSRKAKLRVEDAAPGA
jgi:single-stranded-DNA-specific exonuclease